MSSLVVRGGVDAAGAGLDLLIEEGVISSLGPDVVEPAGARCLDASGLVVLPGVVDPHVHLNEPGRTSWEGFATGTAALAAGGTTTCADMPLNAHPPTLDGASFDLKAAALEGVARVDVALWGGIVGGETEAVLSEKLGEQASRGVIAFKAFMSDSGTDDFPAADADTLGAGMRGAAALGVPVGVHAEDRSTVARLADEARAAGRVGVRDYLDSRPVRAELEAIGLALGLAEETGCALHVVHVSSGAGVALVAEARARGVDATCEVCAHHLVLTEDDALRLGAVAKCAPPLRASEEVRALWSGITEGNVLLLASDHSPSPADMKLGEDAFSWWGGISGAQTLLATMADAALADGSLPLASLPSLLGSGAAERFGLAPAKGSLAVGADADLVLFDPAGSWLVDEASLHDRHKLSPWRGRTLRGRVARVLLRGEEIAVDGVPVGEPRGRLLRRA